MQTFTGIPLVSYYPCGRSLISYIVSIPTVIHLVPDLLALAARPLDPSPGIARNVRLRQRVAAAAKLLARAGFHYVERYMVQRAKF